MGWTQPAGYMLNTPTVMYFMVTFLGRQVAPRTGREMFGKQWSPNGAYQLLLWHMLIGV